MEGFLTKRSRGENTFGSRWLSDTQKNWKRRWFELEHQNVTYYENIDLSSGQPMNEKGTVNISGMEIYPVTNTSKKFVFAVKDPKTRENVLYLQAEDARTMNVWMHALQGAANGENLVKHIDYDRCYMMLKLDPKREHSASEINRAYRKAALGVHPDRGGKLSDFKLLKEAFNHLMAHLDILEEKRRYKVLTYEATVMKGASGMGIVVVEELNKDLRVKQIKPELQIQGLAGEVLDGVKVDDLLIKVAGKDVSKMPLIRVAQRLNDFRVPPKSTVRLTFARKVLRSEEELLAMQAAAELGENPDTAVMDSSSSPLKQLREKEERAASPTTTPGDWQLPSSPNAAATSNTAINTSGVNSPSAASPGGSETATPGRQQSLEHTNSTGSMLSKNSALFRSRKYTAEESEIKSDLDSCLAELAHTSKENEDLLEQKAELEAEVIRYKALFGESVRKQKVLEMQLEQNLVNSTISPAQLQASMEEVTELSRRVVQREPLPIPKDVDEYISHAGLSAEESEADASKSSQRQAIAATASLDKSGLLLKKWTATGDSVVDKLSRLEESVRMSEASGESVSVQPRRPRKSHNNNNNNDSSALYYSAMEQQQQQQGEEGGEDVHHHQRHSSGQQADGNVLLAPQLMHHASASGNKHFNHHNNHVDNHHNNNSINSLHHDGFYNGGYSESDNSSPGFPESGVRGSRNATARQQQQQQQRMTRNTGPQYLSPTGSSTGNHHQQQQHRPPLQKSYTTSTSAPRGGRKAPLPKQNSARR